MGDSNNPNQLVYKPSLESGGCDGHRNAGKSFCRRFVGKSMAFGTHIEYLSSIFHVSSDKNTCFCSKNVRSQGEKSCLQDCDIAFGYLFKSTGKT